jgi:microcystin-dependent protein
MDPFLGEIRLVPFTFAPRGWAFCAGQLLPINQNQALFALLGTTYGGNGRTTFALPDLRGRVPVGADEAAGSEYPLGSSGGHASVKLNVAQLPSHSHAVRASRGPSTTKNPAAAFPASNSVMLGKSGGGQAHENRQPYLSLNYIIALHGIFPARE